MQFSQLGLDASLLRSLDKEGFKIPTPIQEKVIPLILRGEDIMAKAETGSGKSAGFVLPILQYISQHKGEGKAKIKALILTPTRELTLQVAEDFRRFGASLPLPLKSVALIGGERIGDQLYTIQQGCDIVVATTGRMLDILSKKQMNLSHLQFFVLDEADKMLDFGFEQELDLILHALPPKRQNLLFSATYPSKMRTIASKITQEATEVSIDTEKPTIASIHQRAIEVNHDNRGPLLRALLKQYKWNLTLVFMANKRAADNIAVKFRKHGFLAESFHGDLDQEERIRTLQAFKEKKNRILFSTDIAARGLDIDDVNCVINYDLPRSATDYTHRIGRTGRAGKSGTAITFIGHEDQDHFALIKKRCSLEIEKEQIKGFELTGAAPVKEKGKAPVKGKRKSKKDKARELARREREQS